MTASRPITRNSLAGKLLDLAQQFSNESNLYPANALQKQLRTGAGMLRAAATLVHQGTWDRDTAEAWRDAATLTLRKVKEARRAGQ